MKLGCITGSCGCLVVGVVLGALLVWLYYDRLEERHLTPEDVAGQAEKVKKEALELKEKGRRLIP